jgi:KaiC/GvpD/RAD55 family RecA-like ATPase
MERIHSGVSKLDQLLGGGLPVVPDIVVSGSQREIYLFAQQFLWNRLTKGGDLCLFGTLSYTRDEVIEDLASKGWDVSPFLNTGTLEIVDYLSLADDGPRPPDDKLGLLHSIHLEDLVPERFYRVLLREFYALRSHYPNRRFVAILDSVDRMIAAMGIMGTLRFEQMMLELLKSSNSVGVALLCTDFLSEELLDAIRATSSVFIELKHERTRHMQPMVRIVKDVYTDWNPL